MIKGSTVDNIHSITDSQCYIYTRYGYWKLDYRGDRILTDIEMQVANDILRQFYINTANGREYNVDEIDDLVSSINRAIGEGFISWTNWSEKNT